MRGSGDRAATGRHRVPVLGQQLPPSSEKQSPPPWSLSSEQPQHPPNCLLSASPDRLLKTGSSWGGVGWGGARPSRASGPFLAQLTQPRPCRPPLSAEHCPADPGPSLGLCPSWKTLPPILTMFWRSPLAFLFRCSLWDTPTSACFLSLWGGGQPPHVKEPLLAPVECQHLGQLLARRRCSVTIR